MADGKITYKVDVDDSGVDKQLDKTNSSIGKKASGGLGKIGKALGGVALGIGVAAAGMALSIGKAAISAYADFEQLVGGVDTLFGDASQTVQENAKVAFKTAGLSANEYMETVTGLSASLIQSLGGDTAKAAELADQAIIDMSDNANKMGSSVESIQNAYGGFAKQNFTMLDNLKLGYGGTKTEMERLLADAEKVSGIKYDITSLADITSALHVVQTEMGITGTTALEASETISGSMASTQSAFDNLIAGLANPDADFGQLVDDFMGSLGNVIENITPVIGRIVEVLPEVFMALLDAFIILLPQLMESLAEVLPDAISTIVDALVILLPLLVETLIAVLLESLPTLIDGALALFMGLVEALPQIIPLLMEALPLIIDSLITALVTALPLLLDAGIQLLMALVEAIPIIMPILLAALPKIINTVIKFLIVALPLLIKGAVQLFMALIEAIPIIIPLLLKAMPDIIKAIIGAIIDAIPDIIKAGKDLLGGLAKGIGDSIGDVVAKAKEAAAKIVDSVKDFFGISSPSKVFTYIGKMNMDGISKGFEDEEMTVVQNVSRVMDNVTNASAQALEAGTNGTNGQNDSTSLDRLIMGVEKILGKMDGNRANGLSINFNGDFNGDGKAIGDTTAKEIYTKLRQKGVIIGA